MINSTYVEYINSLVNLYHTIRSADVQDIQNEDWLTDTISFTGLYNEGSRTHPENDLVHLYGDDVRYMNAFRSVFVSSV